MSMEGKTFCFSGTLSTQTRTQAQATAKQHGAKVTASVTNSTTHLVAGPGAGAKVKQAESKGVEIWTEEQFNEAVGVGGDEKCSPSAVGESSTPAKRSSKKRAPPAASGGTPTAKQGKKKVPAAKGTPAAKKAKMEPATPAQASGARKVMSCVANKEAYRVHSDYDVKLMLSDSLNANSNKFYKLQLLEKDGQYFVATNWGRLGEPGQNQLKGPHDEEKGIREFAKVFRSKTKNAWGEHPFVRHEDKYQIVETETGEDGGKDASAALGRLTEAQIQKGQVVLTKIRDVLEETTKVVTTKSGRQASRRSQEAELGVLSNEFYSLIPTTSGRQRPPKLDNLEIVTEKEGLLEFWLRMGFEEMNEDHAEGSPIDGVPSLPVPPSLQAAASSITDSGSIASSRDRGATLASQQAGSPKAHMDPDQYAAILLYTGNSIYRELNRCLRTDWPSVRKYWKYLRLYFAAMECMPARQVTLWRGIAVDLYDEYVPGKIITWWTISSCTADQSVAENFMNQLGGAAATLLKLHTKTACDISDLSFYPHEKESLLRPGTKLRVLNRTRLGKVAHIEVEEVLEDVPKDDKKKAPPNKEGEEKQETKRKRK